MHWPEGFVITSSCRYRRHGHAQRHPGTGIGAELLREVRCVAWEEMAVDVDAGLHGTNLTHGAAMFRLSHQSVRVATRLEVCK